MPWCDRCDRYLAPNALKTDGTCPTCAERVDTTDLKNPVPAKVPWHFWLMVAALVVYLGWRLVQGIGWLTGLF
jgi:hypothetical protein